LTEPAQFSFPGLTGFMSGDMTISGHGISPSVANLQYFLQPITKSIGTLSIYDPYNNTQISMRECLISSARGNDGGSMTVTISDRRWKWTRTGELVGHYNRRSADQKLDKKTEKTPRDLAVICLNEMGETGYQIDALPNESRPEVQWIGDNPARALEDLCESLGCRIVYNHIKDRVEIHKLGAGANLPAGGNFSYEATYTPSETPERITVYTGATRFEVALACQAVGRFSQSDASGDFSPFKLLNDLPYKPASGWENESPDLFSGIDVPIVDGQTDETNLNLAKSSVYRCYQIFATLDAVNEDDEQIYQFPELQPFYDRRQIYLESEQIGVKVTAVDEYQPPAIAFGEYCDDELTWQNKTGIIPVDFTVDAANQMIVFSRPVFRLVDRKYKPARVNLLTSCTIEDLVSHVRIGYKISKNIPSGQAGTKEIVKRPEIVRTLSRSVDMVAIEDKGLVSDNIDEVKKEVDYYINAKLAGYQTTTAESDSYGWIEPISCDGAIQQVQYSIENSGQTKTTISRNNERDIYTLTYKERRRLQNSQRDAIATQAVNSVNSNARIQRGGLK